MKKLILILLVVGYQYCYSQNDSKNIAKLDSTIATQRNLIDSQANEIKKIQENLSHHKIKETFFTDEITIATSIFSAILVLGLFFGGFILPKLWEKRKKNKFKQNMNELEAIKNEIKTDRDELKKVALESKLDFHTLAFMESLKSENKILPFINALICIIETMDLKKEDINESDISLFVTECEAQLTDIEYGKPTLERKIEDINEKIRKIITGLSLEYSLSRIKRIEKEINRIYYTKPKQPPIAAHLVS